MRLTVFIDDLLGESTAKGEHQAVGRLTSGAAAVHMAIESDLGCKVAGHKSVLIASSAGPSAASAARRRRPPPTRGLASSQAEEGLAGGARGPSGAASASCFSGAGGFIASRWQVTTCASCLQQAFGSPACTARR